MPQVVIENPVINSPFEEPQRHFRFTDEGITDEIVTGRRESQYFIPIAPPKKRGGQKAFDTEWTRDRVEENKFINRVRQRVSQWRQGGYQGITKTSRRLLEYWQNPDRERRLFFCQIEALETAIYVTEVAGKVGDSWIENHIRQHNEDANPGLFRIAFKMATGSGKTLVMAMLIAYHALNKAADPHSARFSDAFLVVTPGITIRDRLRVLFPNDPHSYYDEHDLVPPDLREQLGRARIIITNFHAFLPRELSDAASLTKKVLTGEDRDRFKETPDQVARRVCRGLSGKKGIIVINDEAHHCYRHRVVDSAEKKERIASDEREEVKRREEAARVWISGLEAVKAKIGIRAVYDLSATPFFLRGSGYSEGTLFQWVVSDFSLIDAIESGIVKVPRVPVADDRMLGDLPTYRNLWYAIRDQLPKKGRGTEAVTGEPILPEFLEGALRSLYSHYEKAYQQWEASPRRHVDATTPPVFIVVCNNTNVSKLVYDWIAGWERDMPDGTVRVQAGHLDLLRNDDGRGGWLSLPTTILVDSQQLESGEAMSAEFKRVIAYQIAEFKAEYRQRFPGRDPESLTDEDLLREVLNTVGKPGRLGQHVKCVVSVSMLTEGWDANTVTHILGVRAFGTQLLCEQVVGRGLRRTSYATERRTLTVNGETVKFDGFPVEYAEVYGVPFSFIPCAGAAPEPKPGPMPTRVRALEERQALEITFPRVLGYRWDIPTETLNVTFGPDCHLDLSPKDVPTQVRVEDLIGGADIHTLDDLRRKRPQTVAFELTRLTLTTYFRDKDGNPKSYLFPQLLRFSRRWLDECLDLRGNAFPQLLLLGKFAHRASECLYRALVASETGQKTLLPVLQPYNTVGSTRYVGFDTTRPTWQTDPNKCHVSHVVGDTESWEQAVAQALEQMPEVISYVKNDHLGFAIPYVLAGEEHSYVPDFIVRLKDGHDDPLNLILEVSGERKPDKVVKVDTARNLWVPAINNHGAYGRWAFVEITDPYEAVKQIRSALASALREVPA
jgi:type III restriction enzyme